MDVPEAATAEVEAGRVLVVRLEVGGVVASEVEVVRKLDVTLVVLGELIMVDKLEVELVADVEFVAGAKRGCPLEIEGAVVLDDMAAVYSVNQSKITNHNALRRWKL
jgi:hypothetical protein